MIERPEHRPDDDDHGELERQREETTDLGYRDSEEERAYDEADTDEPPADNP
jgi:hypothetical protein